VTVTNWYNLSYYFVKPSVTLAGHFILAAQQCPLNVVVSLMIIVFLDRVFGETRVYVARALLALNVLMERLEVVNVCPFLFSSFFVIGFE
jgi:hypothetical protein